MDLSLGNTCIDVTWHCYLEEQNKLKSTKSCIIQTQNLRLIETGKATILL